MLFIELKSGKGRMTQEQKQMQLQFMYLGHGFYEVRGEDDFKEVLRENGLR